MLLLCPLLAPLSYNLVCLFKRFFMALAFGLCRGNDLQNTLIFNRNYLYEVLLHGFETIQHLDATGLCV